MKTLILLRHGKSDWSQPGLVDFDRPLATRGRKAVPLVGRHLRDKGFTPDLVLCSAAERARQTAELVAPEFNSVPDMRFLKSLYLAPPSRLLAAINRIPREVGTVMLIGHNPGMENLARRLIGSGAKKAVRRLHSKFPTSAVAVIGFQGEDWTQIEDRSGELLGFIRPKDLV